VAGLVNQVGQLKQQIASGGMIGAGGFGGMIGAQGMIGSEGNSGMIGATGMIGARGYCNNNNDIQSGGLLGTALGLAGDLLLGEGSVEDDDTDTEVEAGGLAYDADAKEFFATSKGSPNGYGGYTAWGRPFVSKRSYQNALNNENFKKFVNNRVKPTEVITGIMMMIQKLNAYIDASSPGSVNPAVEQANLRPWARMLVQINSRFAALKAAKISETSPSEQERIAQRTKVAPFNASFEEGLERMMNPEVAARRVREGDPNTLPYKTRRYLVPTSDYCVLWCGLPGAPEEQWNWLPGTKWSAIKKRFQYPPTSQRSLTAEDILTRAIKRSPQRDAIMLYETLTTMFEVWQLIGTDLAKQLEKQAVGVLNTKPIRTYPATFFPQKQKSEGEPHPWESARYKARMGNTPSISLPRGSIPTEGRASDRAGSTSASKYSQGQNNSSNAQSQSQPSQSTNRATSEQGATYGDML
jgi:hypothetical protein